MPPFFKYKKQKVHTDQSKDTQDSANHHVPEPIESSLSANLDSIKQKTGHSSDIIVRTIITGNTSLHKASVVYVAGLVDTQAINEFLIEPLQTNHDLLEKLYQQDGLDKVTKEFITLGSVHPVTNWDELFLSLMSGDTIILIDGSNKAWSASSKGGERRSIQEPSTQVSVRGSKESFTESIGTNIAMVRRIINNPDLWIETMKIGKVTRTDVSIMYINGIAKTEVVDEVRKRLKRINIDSILESGYIEQLIEDQTITPFPTIFTTERPDITAGNLLEGRVAIFVNGSPDALLAPALFIGFFQAVEDYYSRYDIATATRFIRVLAFFISLIGPAAYIAITTFHQEMIPTQLLIIVAAQRDSVPFPAFVEAIIMEIAFEILREAGIRMPKVIGSTISIVGALVIGQGAIQAGIVSPATVIVVAITAIANFATPSYTVAISARLIRFLFMIIAAVFGFYGIILGFIMLLVHLVSLRSFGVPYMTPLAPFIPKNLGDTIIRTPLWAEKIRPRLISSTDNPVRAGEDQKPAPPQKRGMKKKNTR
ncbi:spore germination protein [Peribacillus loiseleuriae]|uniref:Spore gernimation protein KB n=1 Tax=Peribacillus loiseleuriae TaxID=1679170 RepID=A0A0K9GQC1_9BACI|nr:spore germination protein [Peribacillus loiseleuriae]KMY48838.1 spore gernimation protein KB [Peribacillus loiseleuriae]